MNSPYIKFLGGAALGIFLISIPIFYSDMYGLTHLTTLQFGLGGLVIVACGSLTMKWGTQFINAVMTGLDNAGF